MLNFQIFQRSVKDALITRDFFKEVWDSLRKGITYWKESGL
jgi:hypothetical protein